MATTIERILQSSGLNAGVSSIAPREMGLTSDTEQPVIGTTVGGAKYLSTEAVVNIITAGPAPLAILRRSRTLCFVDTQAAGASVALDIQAGAQIAGYGIKVFVSGPDTRQAIVTYGVSLIEYIPAGMSQEFIWDGTKWNKTLMAWSDRYDIGSYVESMLDTTPSAKNPIVKLWDADHILSATNYPLLVPLLRAQKVAAWSGSVYVTDHSVTVAGSVITGSGTAWDALLAQLSEDSTVHGGYTSWRPANIAGVDYAITNVSTVGHTITVSGSPATGAQTCIIYSLRIAGSTTTARVYKDSGRATMSQDGTLRIAGLRRRFHMQGHIHPITWYGATAGAGNASPPSGANFTASPYVAQPTGNPATDGINGTPITGPETEPNSATVYRVLWAGAYV